MGVLLYLEVRLRSDSGNINYAGFKADATSNAYVDFITKRGSMEAAALAMSENIKTVMQTQELTVSEKVQLTGVLAEIVGDAELAAVYVGESVTNAEVTAKAYVDSRAGVGDNGSNTVEATKRQKTANALLSESTCSNNDLCNYLKTIDSDAAKEFIKSGNWPEGVQIPKSPDVLNPDGTIKWDKAPEGGYVLDSNGNAIKEQYTPFVGEVIDRFGPPNGRYVCPVKDGKPYGYNKRALPFIEDASQYHQYKVIGDFSKLEEYVESCTDTGLKTSIQEYIDYWCNGDYTQAIVYKGVIARVEGFGIGGGVQYELPIPIEWLIQLELLEEIN